MPYIMKTTASLMNVFQSLLRGSTYICEKSFIYGPVFLKVAYDMWNL